LGDFWVRLHFKSPNRECDLVNDDGFLTTFQVPYTVGAPSQKNLDLNAQLMYDNCKKNPE